MAVAEVSRVANNIRDCFKKYCCDSHGTRKVRTQSAARFQGVLCKMIHLGQPSDTEFCQMNRHHELEGEEWTTSCSISLQFLRGLKGFVNYFQGLLNRVKPNLLTNSVMENIHDVHDHFLTKSCTNAFALSHAVKKIFTNGANNV